QMSSSTDFALSLLRAASPHSENFVISPFSLGAALAIVHDGAKDDTQEQLTRLLGQNLSPAEVSSLYSSLTTALSEKNSKVVTNVANRFFLAKGFNLKPDYASHVEKAFSAGVEHINFKDAQGSANHVNSFVSEHTRGMIPRIVSAPDFVSAIAVLINAVYFKGEWATQFKKEATQTKSFHGISGDRNAQFMRASNLSTRFSQSADLTVVSLAYKDPTYSFVVLMPSGDFGEWRASLTGDKLQLALGSLHMGKINLELPKFKIESETDGNTALRMLGVTRIFEGSANLSGISDGGLVVSKIVHKAVLEVSEEGTEAAAATAVIMTRCRPAPPLKLVFDRPFLYAVVKGNDILFVGQHA
ncbi:hypothetical protein PMAYCL1PPCAC_26316, partial [Pristionchus mayeri]